MQRDIADVSIFSRVRSIELGESVVSQSGLLLAMSAQHTRCFRFDSFVSYSLFPSLGDAGRVWPSLHRILISVSFDEKKAEWA
jgi:hypothetical protein